MRPAIRQSRRRTALATGPGQLVIAGIPIDTQDAVAALQELLGMLAAAPGRMEVRLPPRIGLGPEARSPQTKAHNQQVLVSPRPRPSVGAGVSSMKSFEERLRCSVRGSAAGFRRSEAFPTRPARVGQSKSNSERA